MSTNASNASGGPAAGDGRVPASVLTDIDWLASEICAEIETLARAAADRLDGSDALSSADARCLLKMIGDQARKLGDGINDAAERHGCNHVGAA